MSKLDLRDIPIGITCRSVRTGQTTSLTNFSSYSFDKDITVPVSQFRFTAPDVEKENRMAIRSGDQIELYLNSVTGTKQLVTGFIDETDTHIAKEGVEYQVTGRDTLSQLVDNDAIDENSAKIFAKVIPLAGIVRTMMRNTRIANVSLIDRNTPKKDLLLQTNVGETKMSFLQRMLEFCNSLIWTLPTGQVVIGKPNMHQKASGHLTLSYTSPGGNNLLDARVRRNVNQAIRRLAVQLQDLRNADPKHVTMSNQDKDMLEVAGSGVGTSKYMVYSLGQSFDTVNTFYQVGNTITGENSIGAAYAKRHFARENMNILHVECAVDGHLNSSGEPYYPDQTYEVFIEDEDVSETLYLYGCTYECTPERGLTTRLKLCRLGTIVADVGQTG